MLLLLWLLFGKRRRIVRGNLSTKLTDPICGLTGHSHGRLEAVRRMIKRGRRRVIERGSGIPVAQGGRPGRDGQSAMRTFGYPTGCVIAAALRRKSRGNKRLLLLLLLLQLRQVSGRKMRVMRLQMRLHTGCSVQNVDDALDDEVVVFLPLCRRVADGRIQCVTVAPRERAGLLLHHVHRVVQ